MGKGVLRVLGALLLAILVARAYYYHNSADYTAGSAASTPTASETRPSSQLATEAESETLPIEETSIPERVISEAEIQFWGTDDPELIAEAEPWVDVIDISNEEAACNQYRADLEKRLNKLYSGNVWFASTLEEEYAMWVYETYLELIAVQEMELQNFDLYGSILYRYEDEQGGGLILLHTFSTNGIIAYAPVTGCMAESPEDYAVPWEYDQVIDIDVMLGDDGNEQNRWE